MAKKTNAKMATKTNNNSTNGDSGATKLRTIIEYDLNMLTLRERPISEVYLEELAMMLLNWVKDNEDAVSLRKFFEMIGVREESWHRWCGRCKKLEAAYSYALQILGDRRDEGTTFMEHNVAWTRYVINKYGKKWKDNDLYHAQLKAQSEKTGDITVQIMPMPSTEEVPEKPE